MADLENTTNLVEVTNCAVNASKTDRLGVDARARVTARIVNGTWALRKGDRAGRPARSPRTSINATSRSAYQPAGGAIGGPGGGPYLRGP
jgi:hypothetical protein